MEDKAFAEFTRRRKKKVNTRINKDKFKKSFLKNEKYKRSMVSKSSCKKTYLYSLFKSFIKPYNERNTVFYSILCIINNINRCRFFEDQRCLICKSRETVLEKEEDSDKAHVEDVGIRELASSSNYHWNRRSRNNSLDTNGRREENRVKRRGKNKCSGNVSNELGDIVGEIEIEETEKKVEKERVEKFERMVEKNGKVLETIEESVHVSEWKHSKENLTDLIRSESKKSITVHVKNVIQGNIKRRIHSNETETSKSNLTVYGKMNLSSQKNRFSFFSNENLGFRDIFHFELLDKINMHDKILLDLSQTDIHPTILRTGIFFNKYCNTTHNHRNVDLLIALKCFIQDYSLPPYEHIKKHMKIVIDREINYIIMCKKHSVSMGEVIRWFKCMVSEHIGKRVLEETKECIVNSIDNYIRTKIVSPSISIANYISNNIIEANDVLLLYTFDYVVYLSIVKAKRKGTKFEIILVDSEPYKNANNIKLYTKLGIRVTYTLISALMYNLKKCTKILLGIDAVIHNSVYGSVGTSVICMIANLHNVKVYIICETYKISNKIIIDSFNMNNINNNMDIYNYMYMHHYHHGVSTTSNTTQERNKNKNIDTGLAFNKKLNSQMDSLLQTKIQDILFPVSSDTVNRSPIIRYVDKMQRVTTKKEEGFNKSTKGNREDYEINERRNKLMYKKEEYKEPSVNKNTLNSMKENPNCFIVSKEMKKPEQLKGDVFSMKKGNDSNVKRHCISYFMNPFVSKTGSGKIQAEDTKGNSSCCNNTCSTIRNQIGDVDIKNVCTDKYNETNLFSAVFSHINKINSNSDKSFYVANISNDITPLKYINYIITEIGVYSTVNKNALNVFIHSNI